MRSNEFGSSENVQMKGKRWTGQPETAGYRARRKTIRGVADEETKMLSRVSCANAASESTASDVFIFPKQWKYNVLHALSQMPD